jgi:hypothetical protein
MEGHSVIEHLAAAALSEHRCPMPEQLAAYTLNMLGGTEHLIVAAHVRICPLCRYDIEAARTAEMDEATSARRWRFAFARLVPPQQTAAASYRAWGRAQPPTGGAPGETDTREYRVADISITLTIVPLSGNLWRITGLVEQADMPVAGRVVSLRTQHRRRRQTLSASGFCTFDKVPAGRYTLSVAENGIYVQVRNLVLGHPDTDNEAQ